MVEVQDRFVTFTPPIGAAYLIGDFTDWDERPLPISEPVTIEFPRGAYIEYTFLGSNKRPIADPTNPQTPKKVVLQKHRQERHGCAASLLVGLRLPLQTGWR